MSTPQERMEQTSNEAHELQKTFDTLEQQHTFINELVFTGRMFQVGLGMVAITNTQSEILAGGCIAAAIGLQVPISIGIKKLDKDTARMENIKLQIEAKIRANQGAMKDMFDEKK